MSSGIRTNLVRIPPYLRVALFSHDNSPQTKSASSFSDLAASRFRATPREEDNGAVLKYPKRLYCFENGSNWSAFRHLNRGLLEGGGAESEGAKVPLDRFLLLDQQGKNQRGWDEYME